MRVNDLAHNRTEAANGRDHFLKIEMQELHETITVKRWLTTFLEEYAGSEDCSVADDRIVDDRARAFVSRVDGEDAGFLRLTDKTRFYPFPVTQLGPIWRVAEGYVNPDRRGRGIYTAMLRYAAARAAVHMVYVDLETAWRFKEFYSNCGFPGIITHNKSGMASMATKEFIQLLSSC